MAFDPDAYLGSNPAAPVAPAAPAAPAPAAPAPAEPAAPVTPAAGFDPDAFLATTAESLTKDDNFDPVAHAAQSPDNFDLAYQVYQAKQARPLGDKVASAFSDPVGTVKHAAAGVGNFLKGLFYQVPKDTLQQAYFSATDQPEQALTKQAEATLTAQNMGGSVDATVDATLGRVATAASKLDDPNPARTAWRTSFLRRNPAAREKYEALWAAEDAKDAATRSAELDKRAFGRKVAAAKDSLQLQQGKPLDTGAVAGLYKSAGQLPSEEVGPEALAAAGAPAVDPEAVAAKSAAADPNMLLLSMAPSLPGAGLVGGRVAQGVGKALQLPMRGLEMLPGKTGAVATATGAGAGVALAETAIHNPVLAAKIAGGAGAAKGLQKLGQVMEAQGREMATGTPSELSTRAATGRLEAARGTGARDLGAELGVKVGNAPGQALSTAVGMAPLNAALSDDDPKKFMELSVGAGAFGGALGALHSNRPVMVEALRPYLRSEGARTMETDTALGKKSSEYLMSLPEEERDRAMETMGALQGLSTQGSNGEKGYSRFYVVDGETYKGELKKVAGESASGGGRGFFVDASGNAIINGDAQGGAGDLSHTMGHEGGHMAAAILRAAGEQGSRVWDGMVHQVTKELLKNGEPTKEFQEFIDTYNKAFDPSGKYQHLDPHDPLAIEEFLAEHAGRILSGEGTGFALPKSIGDRIEEGVGHFAARALGLDKIGQTSKLNRVELASATQLMRDTLAQVAQAPREAAPAPEAAQDPAKPAPAVPGRTPDQINRTARLDALNIREESVDAAREKTIRDAIAAEKARRGKRPMSEKSEGEIADASGREFDEQLERYTGALEGEGVPHPAGMSITEALLLNELSPNTNLPKWKGWGRARPGVQPAKAPLASIAPAEPAPEAQGTQGALAQVPAATATEAAPARPLETFGEPEPAPEPAPQPTPEPAKPRLEHPELQDRLQAAEEAARAAEAGKKRRNEETRAKATTQAVKEARIRALAEAATEDAAGETDPLQIRKDETGKERITGQLDTSIPSHQLLAEELGLSADDVATVNQFQSGKMLYVDYLSAKNREPEDLTGLQRRKEYAANSPDDRGEGNGTLQRNKAILGVTLSVGKGGGATIRGVSVDKYLANAKKLLDYAGQKEIATGYTGINDLSLVRDLNGYVENHRHGYKGDGSGPVKGETATPDYQPHAIPRNRFNLLNAAFHADVSGKVDSNRADTRGSAMDAQARALENDWMVDDATGDTNPLRAFANTEGDFVHVNRKGERREGTGEILESVWENLAPDMVKAIKDSPDGETETVRDVGFSGDAAELFKGGLPNFKHVEAGFMPGEKGDEGALSDFAPENDKPRAKFMAYAGETAHGFEDAEREGRVFRGRYDGRQRFELDDSKAKLQLKPDETGVSRTLRQVLDHPELFKAYPELGSLLTNIDIDPTAISSGKYVEGWEGNAEMYGRDPEMFITAPNREEARKTLLHELQHAIQEREGFAKGGSPRDFETMDLSQVAASGKLVKDYEKARPILEWLEGSKLELNEENLRKYAKEHGRDVGDVIYEGMYAWDDIQNRAMTVKELDDKIAHHNDAGGRWMTGQTQALDKYRSLAGEIESRDVEARADLTDKERQATPPYSSEDIPREKAIIQFMPGEKEGPLSRFGQPDDEPSIKSKVTESPAFKKWFGESKAVDKDGTPIVVYHGSVNRGVNEFDTTRETKRGKGDVAGTYFTTDSGAAASYTRAPREAGKPPQSGEVTAAYLKIENPLNTTAAIKRGLKRGLSFGDAKREALKALTPEHDGIIFEGTGSAHPEYVVFKPEQIKSATKNNGNFDAASPDIRFMPGDKEGQLSKFGEQDDLGFTSTLQKVVADKLPNRASREQVLATLDPAKSGVKKEEMDWMGLPEFLKDKDTVTKQELLDFIKSNQVELKEVVKGGTEKHKFGTPEQQAAALKKYEDARDAMGEHKYGSPEYNEAATTFREMQKALRDIAPGWGRAPESEREPTKFQNYRLPGGENYKEVLLTLPTKGGAKGPSGWGDTGGGTAQENVFKSSHWDEPNVLAHIRQADLKDAEGNKVRVIEEIQSDWHQKGRKHGYKASEQERQAIAAEVESLEEQRSALVSKYSETGNLIAARAKMTPEERAQERALTEKISAANNRDNEEVPDAPFKKTWHELAFKKALRSAVEDGADKIAWVMGEEHARRYKDALLRELKSVEWSTMSGFDESGNLVKRSTKGVTLNTVSHAHVEVVIDAGGKIIRSNDRTGFAQQFIGKGLDEVIGKDNAEKVVSATDNGKLDADGLTVGGEGMKGFYDKILPDFVRKYVKKWGGKVETTEVGSRVVEAENGSVWKIFPDKAAAETWASENMQGQDFKVLKNPGDLGGFVIRNESTYEFVKPEPTKQDGTTLHSVTITPQMRESVKAGQPLFMPDAEAGAKSKGEAKIASKEWIEKGVKSPFFKRWFGDWESRPESASKVVDDDGKPLVVYSGHGNASMYGDAYDPKKGTAGGFYASENPLIASNYSMGKFGNKEEYSHGSQYRFQLKNGKWGGKIWQQELSPAQVEKAREWLRDDENGVTDVEEYAKHNADYDEHARRLKYRGLKDLGAIHDVMESLGYTIAYPREERTLPDGEREPLFMRQQTNQFEDLMDHLGIKWQSYDWNQPGVMPLYLDIKRPIDAEKPFPADLLAELKERFKRTRNREASTSEQWTKSFPVKEWIKMIEDGNEFWTTQIPKDALPIIKQFGYDGIKELGLKGEKDRAKRQINWIAFDPEQIKSATGNRGTFDPSKADMRLMPGASRRTWFVRNGQRVYHRRDGDGRFTPKPDSKPSLASFSPAAITAASSNDRKKTKPLEAFQ